MDLDLYLAFFTLTALVLLCVAYFIVISGSSGMPDIVRYEDEKYYLDFSTVPPTKEPFPSLYDDSSKSLSVIVPAFNEEDRLPPMLEECLDFLENRCTKNSKFSYEVVIVDDGSTDSTSKVALEYGKNYGPEKFRVLTLAKNRGKGGAVRLGMLSSRGEYLLFADADGATKFGDVEKMEEEIGSLASKNINSVVIGSRAQFKKGAIVSRSFFRNILMHSFHFLVWLFAVRSVRDTQCGFKMFTREAARRIFLVLHVERWAFDVELLYLAEKMNMNIKEIAVNWTEIEGSKLVPFWSWLQMGRDLVLIWLKYQLRIWKICNSRK